jgi:hypothetical protein
MMAISNSAVILKTHPLAVSVVREVPIGIRYRYGYRTRYYPVLPSTKEIPVPTTAGTYLSDYASAACIIVQY